MAEDRGKTRFDELFSGLSRRHDGNNARQHFSKLHSVDNISKAQSDFNYTTLTSARNYATIVSNVENKSSNSEEEDDEDDDPIVFREKLQKSKTIRIPKSKEGADSADVIDNESSEKFAFNVAQKRMSLFQPTNQLSKEENDQLKDALKETSSNSEDENDDEKVKGIRANSELDQIYKLQQKEKRMSEVIEKMKLIDIVQKNERSENSSTVLINNTLELFDDDSEIQIPKEEKKLLEYIPLDSISRRIYDNSNEQSDGNPICAMQFCDVLCIGFTKGVIRIYDLQTYEELKVFIPKKRKNFGNKVTCLDISLQGNKLIAGYASGKFCVFDIQKQKIIIEDDDQFSIEIESIKFLSNLSSNQFIIADKKGHVRKITVTKGLLKSSFISEKFLELPIHELCTIAALTPKVGMPFEVADWQLLNLVAISSTDQFSIYVLQDPFNIIFKVTKSEFGKDFIKSGSLCYLDWGYGVTPNILREKSKCLLAIAWDKVLQIMILEDPNKGMGGIRFDGYYICDYPIDKVLFISDSVLMILVNK